MKPYSSKFLVIALTFALAGISARLTTAGPVPMEQAPVAEPASWTGFYIGGNLGGSWSDFDFSDYDTEVDLQRQFFDTFNVRTTAPNDPELFLFETPIAVFHNDGHDAGTGDSFTGGGQLGYQMQFGHFVVGVEGDINRTSTSSSSQFAETQTFLQSADTEGDGDGTGIGEFFSTTDFDSFRKAEAEWTGSARARLGYAKGPLMLYVTGGVAFAEVDVFARDTARTHFYQNEFLFPTDTPSGGPGTTIDRGTVSNTNLDQKDSDVLVGWTAGGGCEYMINEMLSIGLEYRHSDYGSETLSFGPEHATLINLANGAGSSSSSEEARVFPGHMSVDMQNDQVTFRVNILLNRFFGR